MKTCIWIEWIREHKDTIDIEACKESWETVFGPDGMKNLMELIDRPKEGSDSGGECDVDDNSDTEPQGKKVGCEI